jgi:hypothetical protein
MTDNANYKNTVIPQEMAQLEWIWVLTTAITRHRDSMFILEMDGQEGQRRRRVIPIFESREDAAKLKLRLCQHKSHDYTEQAMLLSDVGTFAAKNELEIMLLDENGTILAHMEAKLEQFSVH